MRTRSMWPAIALAATTTTAAAEAPLPDVEIDAALVRAMREVVANPVVDITLEAQNARHAGWDQARKTAADERWRRERTAAAQPTITRIAASPLSTYLTDVAADSYGLFAEIFVADAIGLNAGISSVTSDFDQSDEAKYRETVLVGPEAVFVDAPEYNAAKAMWIRQVNLTISDADGRPAGVAVFDVNLHELARRRAFAKDAS